jgi:hypothetical protein
MSMEIMSLPIVGGQQQKNRQTTKEIVKSTVTERSRNARKKIYI